MAGNHQFGKAVRFLRGGRHGRESHCGAMGIEGYYAAWLMTHARKIKRGIIRVVVSEKNDGRETASIQAHHYRYVLDDDLTPETRHYVETVIARSEPSTLTSPEGGERSRCSGFPQARN